METFTEPRDLVENPRYPEERRVALEGLGNRSIDGPIVDIIRMFTALPYCFTLQCCYGHFICAPGQSLQSLDPVPADHAGSVRYRIAYVSLCIQNGDAGRALLASLGEIPKIDPDYVQFGSADWFWERWINSYALQVEPRRYKNQDEVILPADEARHVQHTRDRFFAALREVLARQVVPPSAGGFK